MKSLSFPNDQGDVDPKMKRESSKYHRKEESTIDNTSFRGHRIGYYQENRYHDILFEMTTLAMESWN